MIVGMEVEVVSGGVVEEVAVAAMNSGRRKQYILLECGEGFQGQ